MTSQRAVGIDLGTTYSVAAWVDGSNRTAVIANSEGDILTPSAVVFEEHEIIVGKQAGKLGVMKADRLAECVKRDMGNPFYSRPIDGEFLPPEVIQACVLKKIHQDVTEKIGPDFRVVITVPAFFDDSRRRATAIAGEIAGLDVLDIVNEPMAGALAFGEHLDALHSLPAAPQDLKVLVYDLGGGTFDATLLSINQSAFRTLATDGDVRLGGRDWDQRLVDMACEQFIRRFREDPRDNPVSLQRLLAEVERAKQTLSARPRAVVRVDHAGNSLETQVTRDAFEERTADLLERTAHTTRELLVTAGLEWKHVSRILLVGGATRMPMVSKMLEELSGAAADYVVSPDEAVARGAAIYAKHLLDTADGSPSKFQITNVNSHNLGVQGIEQATQQKVNAVLISRNTPLPVKTTRRFVTRRADQRSIAILVLEGESPLPSECTVIGRSVIEDLPRNLPKGHPIEVTYEYAANARLSVRASLPSVDRDVRIEIERGARLPDDGIAHWKKAVSGGRGLAVLRKVLNRQAKGEKRPWRQLSVTYDDVLVGPEQRDEEGRLGEGPLQLEPTTQTVPAANADPAEDAATPADSITAAYRRPPRVRKRRRQKSAVLEVLKFVGGGILGLAIGQMVIWWGLHQDPFELGPSIPAPFNVIVPAEFRKVPDGRGLIENSIGMKLVLIPEGEFDMGSPADEERRNDDEGPVHRVRITKPFFLGVTEVTQGQWEEVMDTRPWAGEKWTKSGTEHAVSNVSWDDAVEFCWKLSARDGRKYRLPTEAEWEYACRAETTTRFSFGDDSSDLGSYAQYDQNTSNVGAEYAHPVGLKRANDWGLYDMHGNVWEWCADWYGVYERSPTVDPTGPTSGSFRVMRGGSWYSVPGYCRSAFRGWSLPTDRYAANGFRVAQVP